MFFNKKTNVEACCFCGVKEAKEWVWMDKNRTKLSCLKCHDERMKNGTL